MSLHTSHRRRALSTTALGTVATIVLFSASMAHAAFNPNEGVDAKSALPSTAPLIEPSSRFSLPADRRMPLGNPAATAVPPGAYVQPIPAAAPSAAPAPLASTPPGAFVQPIPPIADVTPIPTAPVFPPVDADVAAKAARELGVTAPIPVASAAPTQGFIAPAPLLAGNPLALQRPVENPPVAPLAVGSIPPVSSSAAPVKTAGIPTPAQPLSNASKDILSKFPSKLGTNPAVVSNSKDKNLAINRLSPDIQAILPPEQKVERYDAAGISIKVQRPGLDTNFELNRAYAALNAGDTTLAASTYKNILSTEPKNEDALFGLATVYHRLGDLDRARPYYAQLLTVNPNHREGLNNFLALVSHESPQEALAELERLEQRNPNFSPIPAQQAALLSKQGFADQAREKMLRAIELAPENLTYKYNLAVILDKQGKYTDASALYRLLIDAAINGQKIPASLDALQKRLNFIATASTGAQHVGG